MNVGKILEMCCGCLDLKDSRVDSLGMFVYDLGEIDDTVPDESDHAVRNPIRTPRPLKNEDFIDDIIFQVID